LNTNETGPNRSSCFLVLLPHRDSQNIIEDCRKNLFATGFKGAYAFPVAAPLAVLSKSLNREELKQTALEIREASLENDGKITASGTGRILCPEEGLFRKMAFCGPLIDIPQTLSALDSEKTLYAFPRAILCAMLDAGLPETRQIALPEFPIVSFGAAMVANLVIRQLKDGNSPYSLEWKLGTSCWLPGK
jgi:hypothetical protein